MRLFLPSFFLFPPPENPEGVVLVFSGNLNWLSPLLLPPTYSPSHFLIFPRSCESIMNLKKSVQDTPIPLSSLFLLLPLSILSSYHFSPVFSPPLFFSSTIPSLPPPERLPPPNTSPSLFLLFLSFFPLI